MRNPRDEKKGNNWIGLAVMLLVTAPQFFIPVGIFAGIVYLAVKLVKSNQNSVVSKKTTYTKQQSAFDDCPKPLFCFHKDKGEHHVVRGREIDPWDRPDIDISKYQRKE